MKPTKHNPVARAVKKKKATVVPSKKYEGPLVEDYADEVLLMGEEILDWYKRVVADVDRPVTPKETVIKRGIKIDVDESQ